RAKGGGSAIASAERKPSPISWAKGVPITSHQGFSRSCSVGQHCGHSVPGQLTRLRQPTHTGGKRMSPAPARTAPAIFQKPAIPPARPRDIATFATISRICDGARTRNERSMDALFDTKLLLSRKLRASAQGDSQAWFLMDRAADELAERLSAVERRFQHAAALFCLTDAGKNALQRSGKVRSVLRVEADRHL